jgi:hypothetical protein
MALKDDLTDTLLGDVKTALTLAGEVLKQDLWKPEDDAFLAARAADLVGLNRKAQATTNPAKKQAYQAAARDTLQSVKMLALIRAEATKDHLIAVLGKVFMDNVLPQLIKLLPVIIAAL